METHYRLLKILNEDPHLSQRALAEKVGISLGKVNFCLAELATKGLIKVSRFKSSRNKVGYAYLLTPRGIEEKTRLTLHFLKRKAEEYELIRQQIKELHHELEKEQQSIESSSAALS